MYAFNYHQPKTLQEATALLADSEAKLLAGGHSLVPVMKLRLASPGTIIDLSKIGGLAGVEVKGGKVTIGAMTRHKDVAGDKALLAAMPALAGVPDSIGDPHVRNRGTIGGSIANNDPNADYPASCMALGATIVTTKRRIGADDFFVGMFETALEPDEIITQIEFPVVKASGYEKFKHPASGFALVGVFVAKHADGVRVGVTGAGANGVFRVPAFEEALTKNFSPDALKGLSIPEEGLNSDIHAGAEYRAHLVGVMARRATAKAVAGAK
ncbi:MAG TPA: xanthine dehydrogenase family protein subunit M [Xanthobacteraceae bacterium]|jgi:carbon-monoxide dehydrogenase medium subunit